MKEKINDIIDRLFHLECEVISIHKAAKKLFIEDGLTSDEWFKLNKARNICICLLNTLNS